MAFENNAGNVVGVVAGANLSADQYKIVKLDANGDAVLAGAGELAIGVLYGCPDLGDAAGIYGVGSTAKVEAGAPVTAGDAVAADASGLAAPAAVGNFILGVAQSSAAAGELVSVHLNFPGKA